MANYKKNKSLMVRGLKCQDKVFAYGANMTIFDNIDHLCM